MTREIAIEIARRAGAVLLDGLTRERQIELKGPFDLVTDVDRASEALIVAALAEQFPNHGVIGEEGAAVLPSAEWTWVIDPLDGTNNYAHGFPQFSVSMALLHHRVPQLGIVFDPLRDELFVGERGQGAFLNGAPIRVSSIAQIGRSLVSTGFPYDFSTNPANNVAEFVRVHQRVQGVRRAGSAALDLAYVACGRLDAHWELGLKAWDSAAGSLMVTEAGGEISTKQGGEWNPWSTTMLASNGAIHRELLQVLNEQQ